MDGVSRITPRQGVGTQQEGGRAGGQAGGQAGWLQDAEVTSQLCPTRGNLHTAIQNAALCTHRLQLSCEDLSVVVRLAGIQHHQQQIRALAHGDDLPAAACCAHKSGFAIENQTRQEVSSTFALLHMATACRSRPAARRREGNLKLGGSRLAAAKARQHGRQLGSRPPLSMARPKVLTLALCCPLDDPRQIQQLNLGVVVVDDAGNACEPAWGRREGEGRGHGVGEAGQAPVPPAQPVQLSRFEGSKCARVGAAPGGPCQKSPRAAPSSSLTL